jgi:hypothetical protein
LCRHAEKDFHSKARLWFSKDCLLDSDRFTILFLKRVRVDIRCRLEPAVPQQPSVPASCSPSGNLLNSWQNDKNGEAPNSGPAEAISDSQAPDTAHPSSTHSDSAVSRSLSSSTVRAAFLPSSPCSLSYLCVHVPSGCRVRYRITNTIPDLSPNWI